MKLYTVILAAGRGKRMNSDKPKVLHKIGGVPMINNSLLLSKKLNSTEIIVVTGHEPSSVEDWITKNYTGVKFVRQKTQLGTGHAVKVTEESMPKNEQALLLVLYGDTPFISYEKVNEMIELKKTLSDLVVLGFEHTDPNSYGKLIESKTGFLEKIIEHKDASPRERRQKLCNSGILLGSRDNIFNLLNNINHDNAQNELYLTDIVEAGNRIGLKTKVVACSAQEAMGVNSMSDLAEAENLFQIQMRSEMLENGVSMLAPETVYFSYDTKISKGSMIEPNVIFGEGVILGENVKVRAFSHLEGCNIKAGAIIGPFARIRPGTEIGKDSKIGNFVEIKNSSVGHQTKINHLAYVGDADLGEKVNFGAGSIICNYDGVKKHRTKIGAGAFVGSNSSLVAPIKIGNETIVGSGSVITKDVPDKDLALSRTPQTNKKDLGKKIMNHLKSKK